MGYELDEATSEFTVSLNETCSFTFENSYQLKYGRSIEGVIERERLMRLTVKVTVVWLPLPPLLLCRLRRRCVRGSSLEANDGCMCAEVLPTVSLCLGSAIVEEPVAGESLFTWSKVLLNDISGDARDGDIFAVLGASSSGKSTLVDALVNRIVKGSLKGSVTLNGEALELRLLKVILAYVMRDDLLFPMLTVEEEADVRGRVPLPLDAFQVEEADAGPGGLRNSGKTVIGDEGHCRVSGGEQRCVSIGTDIIHDPIILFLDEPTSGLDSTSAYMVGKVL